MKVEQVEHVGLTVKNLDESLKFYTGVLGIKPADIQMMEVPGVLRGATILTRGSKIELLQFLNDTDPLAKYADKQADNLHHYAINVDNITEALSVIKKQGGTLIHETPMQMPGGRKFAYIIPPHSKVLIELLED
jgi:methylmalonyl-CoA epimerase